MPQGLPYDGWYNGRADLMIKNGTYADFRPLLEERARRGKIVNGDIEKSMAQLKRWDKEWNAIPLEARKELRANVVADATPEEVQVMTAKGPMKVRRSKPSNNNNLDIARDKKKQKPKFKVPAGTLTNENNPLEKETPPAPTE